MIWLTWRQHRAEVAVGAAILAVLAAALGTLGAIARSRAGGLGLPGCLTSTAGCPDALDSLHGDFHSIPPFIASLIAIPLLAGMFWAAPLVAREFEAGTYRLAWTQSVSPLRWITTKIVLIFSVTAAAALALGLLVNWTLRPLAPAFGGRYNSTWYDVSGIVPVACMLFALAVGVAASALIRRTIPAMAVTLVVYAAARIPIHWVRAHFVPPTTRAISAPFSALFNVPLGRPQDVFTSHLAPGDWLVSATVTDPAGRPIPEHAANLTLLQQHCPDLPSRGAIPEPVIEACRAKVAGLRLHETIQFQPASHFWLIQTVETAIFVGLAAALVVIAVAAVRRRRTA